MGATLVGPQARREYLERMRERYVTATRAANGRIPPEVAERLRMMSPRQMDRCLRPYKRERRKRQYGRTKPGTLLKQQIPLRTDRWDVHGPGFTEIDLVTHSGDRVDGECVHSLNVTDIHTT